MRAMSTETMQNIISYAASEDSFRAPNHSESEF